MSEERSCRLCLEHEPAVDLLCDACACKGTQATVHSSCLRAWQRHAIAEGRLDAAVACGVCRARFTLAPPRISWRDWARAKVSLRHVALGVASFTTMVSLTFLLLLLLDAHHYWDLGAGGSRQPRPPPGCSRLEGPFPWFVLPGRAQLPVVHELRCNDTLAGDERLRVLGVGSTIVVRCPGTCLQQYSNVPSVQGSQVYSPLSPICASAAHAQAVAHGRGTGGACSGGGVVFVLEYMAARQIHYGAAVRGGTPGAGRSSAVEPSETAFAAPGWLPSVRIERWCPAEQAAVLKSKTVRHQLLPVSVTATAATSTDGTRAVHIAHQLNAHWVRLARCSGGSVQRELHVGGSTDGSRRRIVRAHLIYPLSSSIKRWGNLGAGDEVVCRREVRAGRAGVAEVSGAAVRWGGQALPIGRHHCGESVLPASLWYRSPDLAAVLRSGVGSVDGSRLRLHLTGDIDLPTSARTVEETVGLRAALESWLLRPPRPSPVPAQPWLFVVSRAECRYFRMHPTASSPFGGTKWERVKGQTDSGRPAYKQVPPASGMAASTAAGYDANAVLFFSPPITMSGQDRTVLDVDPCCLPSGNSALNGSDAGAGCAGNELWLASACGGMCINGGVKAPGWEIMGAGQPMTMTTEQDDLLEANGVWQIMRQGAGGSRKWEEDPSLYFRCADEAEDEAAGGLGIVDTHTVDDMHINSQEASSKTSRGERDEL